MVNQDYPELMIFFTHHPTTWKSIDIARRNSTFITSRTGSEYVFQNKQ